MSRFVVTATWDENAPHLTEKARADLWGSIPAYQRDARGKGIPQLGAGVIFPIPEEDIVCDPFPIPPHWRQGYGLDVGWNKTAAMFRAFDPDNRISYFTFEYYRGEANPEVHAAAIRRRASALADGQVSDKPWMPGRIDPAARGRSQEDGEQLLKMYRELIYGSVVGGAQLLKEAKNAVESGLYDELMALTEGRLKVFKTCRNWLAERRLYRRNEKGQVVKKFDHAQDAGRYNMASGDTWLVQMPAPPKVDPLARFASGGGSGSELGWMR